MTGPLDAGGSSPLDASGAGDASSGRAHVTAVTADLLRASLENRVARNNGYGGGVLRVESATGGVLFEGAAGEIAAGDRTMRPSDAFEVASITKTFTAAVVLLLVEDGKLALDTPLGELLGREIVQSLLVVDGVDHGPRLTVRQLLAHRSGLPDYWNDPPRLPNRSVNAFMAEFLRDSDRMWQAESIVPFVRRLRPAGMPGAQYHYSDSNYLLLGLVVERLARAPLHEVLRERLLAPLGLQQTYFSYREERGAGISLSHRHESKADLHGQRRQSADWASGGLVSTAADLGRFILALSGGKVFRHPETLAAMKAWEPTSKRDVDYGLGLFRVRLGGGLGEVWGHDGHGNAFMYYWPLEEIAWLGTLNQTDNDWWPLVDAGTKTLRRNER